MNNTTRIFTNLHTLGCLLVDLPPSKFDCYPYNETLEYCIRCRRSGRFFSGESVDDFGGSGHIISALLWLLTFLVGVGGSLGNIVIINILSRRQKNSATSSFDLFLKSLAYLDLICCVCCVIVNTAVFFYYENLSRNVVTIYVYWLSGHTSIFAKSASSFITVTITVERYLAVAWSTASKKWVNNRRTYFLISGVILFSLFLAMGRYTSTRIGAVQYMHEIESTKNIDYVILSTRLAKFWYVTLKGFFNQVDFWLPLPLLLLFNGLVYFHILKFSKRRAELTGGQRKDIRAVKMFFPVVIVLFLCNIIPIIHYAFIVSGYAYRELDMAMRLSFAFNAAVNLPIYYYKGTGFKQETQQVIVDIFPVLGKWLDQKKKSGGGGQESSTSGMRDTSSVMLSNDRKSSA